jgi:signal transduction histidine kinase
MEHIIAMAQGCLSEIRSIITQLRPSILDDLGLLATMDWHCREFHRVYSQIAIVKNIGLTEDDVPGHLKIVIYRILQEALSNVARHSHADTAWISLLKKGKSIEMEVRDNGRGFDFEQNGKSKAPGKGFGLTSMRERTLLSGGLFRTESFKGTGTGVCASWPIEAETRASSPI